ncbi:hypothetical protein F5B20DRAFT_55887 [Whalleya microplaca]|nr:hypothetical protein F5B20DRAFT_55887 [Whalleya microplaca]
MDPTAMEFMMHQPDHAGSSSAIDHTARSACPACPALRAAAEQNQHSPVLPPTRQTSHYDPVHGSAHTNLWHRGHASHSWHQYNLLPPNNPRFVSDNFQSPSAAAPSRPNHASQPSYATPSGPDPYNIHPHLPLHYNRPMSGLHTVGGTAPIQHSQGLYVTYGQAQAAATTGHGTEGHVARAPSGQPVLGSFTATGRNPQGSAFSDSLHANQQSDSRGSPYFSVGFQDNGPIFIGRPDFNGPSRRADEVESSLAASQSPPRRLPPVSHATAGGQAENTSNPSESRRIPPPTGPWTPMARRTTSASNSSSENDIDSMDPIDPDSPAYSFIEAISGGGGGSFGDSMVEDRLRAQQILRGTVSGKRVASKKAITSLESVNISDLPENEKTCVICYNEFGVQAPEGVNEAPLRLPKCKHVFGDHCIKKWFEESDSCPYCRDKVPSEPQYRQQGNAHNVYRFIRQHQLQVQQFQAARQSRDRDRADPGSLFSGLSSSPFAEFGYDTLSETAARRAESQSVYGTRPPAWHNTPERRSPPSEFNENRRRTRARHGSLRGSPPSGRPHLFGAAAANGSSPPYAWFNRGNQNHPHNHRHSVASSGAPLRPAFDANGSPFAFSSQMNLSSEAYLNPLNATSPASSSSDGSLPHMRSQYSPNLSPPNLSPPTGSLDVYLAHSDDIAMGRATSQQQS